MPLTTGGPVITGVPPEQWAEILKVLQQFGVTVWDLAQQGITTWEGAGGLKEYLINNGWEQIEFWELKTQWVHTGAGNATQSNALVQYLGNEITLAGAAGSQYVKHFSFGGSTISKLKKGVVFGALFSLLVSSLDPSFITDALKGRLGDVIDRFADENGEVPVMVGEDGKTYYHEDMINALRQALIDEGVYDSGLAPSMPANVRMSYVRPNQSTLYYDLNPSQYNTQAQIMEKRDSLKWRRNGVDYTIDTLCIGTFDNPEHIYHITGWVGCCTYDSSGQYATYSYIPITDEPITPFYNKNVIYTDASLMDDYISFSTGTRSIGTYTLPTGETFTTDTDMNGTYNLTSSFITMNFPTVHPYMGFSPSQLYNIYGVMKGGDGVEGITVASDLISRGISNIATSLEDVFPSFASDHITTINPTDEDLTAHENWYPLSTSDYDVWTDGITEQQSETATDGEVSPDIQEQIADAIKQILEDYYRDPTDPNVINYPEIPAGDSGDTPPENPPLTPPSGSTGSNGLWSIYNPTMQQVNEFGAWLWSDSLADQFKRIFNSPIDGVIGFHMIYCTPTTGAASVIKCGFLSSPVSAPVVTNPYAEIDCGTVSIDEYYRNALDYDNTRIALYLPFVGIVPLDTNVVMGSSINVTYRIDILTGTCLAQVKVIKEGSNAVMYAFDGNCAVQIPLTATTYTGMVGALLSGITAGASIMTGNMVQAINSGINSIASGFSGLSGARQSGTFGANVGALGIRKPYIIITHPVSAMPAQFNDLEGLPANILVSLGSLSGFTRVRSVHLENIGKATDEEITMITDLLKEGVII